MAMNKSEKSELENLRRRCAALEHQLKEVFEEESTNVYAEKGMERLALPSDSGVIFQLGEGWHGEISCRVLYSSRDGIPVLHINGGDSFFVTGSGENALQIRVRSMVLKKIHGGWAQ